MAVLGVHSSFGLLLHPFCFMPCQILFSTAQQQASTKSCIALNLQMQSHTQVHLLSKYSCGIVKWKMHNFRNLILLPSRRLCLAHFLFRMRHAQPTTCPNSTQPTNFTFDRSTRTHRCRNWAQCSTLCWLRGWKFRLARNQPRVCSTSDKCSDSSHPFNLIIFAGRTKQKRAFRSNNLKRMSVHFVSFGLMPSMRW